MIHQEIFGIAPEYSQKILKLFESLPEGTEVWLFCSRAKGNYREGSDIDLAFKGTEVDLGNRDEVLIKYDTLFLPWKLDIVIFAEVEDPSLRSHIDRVGILVFSK